MSQARAYCPIQQLTTLSAMILRKALLPRNLITARCVPNQAGMGGGNATPLPPPYTSHRRGFHIGFPGAALNGPRKGTALR